MWGLRDHWRVTRVHAFCLSLACLALAACASASAEARKVTGFEVIPRGREVILKIASPGAVPLSMRSFPLRNPRRLVFDLQNASLVSGLPESLAVSGLGITQARVKQFSADPAVARLVLDLNEGWPEPLWSVRPSADRGATLLVLSPPPPQQLSPPALTTDGKSVQVRLAGAGGLPRQTGCLEDPPRIYIDITCATTPTSIRQTFAAGPVREVRLAPHALPDGTPTVRLVAELSAPRLYSETTAGNDLVIALEETPAQAMPEPEDTSPLAHKLIVVDPGHGGEDSGAPSAAAKAKDRVLEKDITLDIGLRLARLLSEKGATVVLTREDDTYLPLPDRADVANRLKAAAFVSVHCNSCGTPNTLHGTAVYYDHGNSIGFAKLVQAELVQALGRADNGIRNANFSVIRRAQCPGVLVETAYINHDEEVSLLSDPDFRERAAEGIVKGVVRFFAAKASHQAARK